MIPTRVMRVTLVVLGPPQSPRFSRTPGAPPRVATMYVLSSLFVVWTILTVLSTMSLVRDLRRQRIIEERAFAAHNHPVRATGPG